MVIGTLVKHDGRKAMNEELAPLVQGEGESPDGRGEQEHLAFGHGAEVSGPVVVVVGWLCQFHVGLHSIVASAGYLLSCTVGGNNQDIIMGSPAKRHSGAIFSRVGPDVAFPVYHRSSCSLCSGRGNMSNQTVEITDTARPDSLVFCVWTFLHFDRK
jgi:hypothetical protein